MPPVHTPRYWELDLLRGIAILLMIVYHFFFDLNFLSIINLRIYESPWWNLLARAVAVTFILLVGLSLRLNYSSSLQKGLQDAILSKLFKRGIKIFTCGLGITFVTKYFLNEGTVVFGILHFIGLATIISYPFLKNNFSNLLLGIIFIIFGIYLQQITIISKYFFWLGLMPKNFYTLDYFPFFPWFGVILLGIFMGKNLYLSGHRKFPIPNYSSNLFIKKITFLGRHSLIIYLIHQPILISLLLVIKNI